MTTPTNRRSLFGWKEIARYLNSSVRTVQRWHRALGLPTHHVCIQPRKQTPVYAFTDQLDAWVEARPRLISELDQLREEVVQLRQENATLRRVIGWQHRAEES